MGQFLKFLLASCLGLFIGFFLLMGIGALVIGQAISASEKVKDVEANSVLHLTLDRPIPEQTNNLEIDPFAFETESTLGLTAIVEAIDRAAEDDDIKGIFLEPEQLSAIGLASSGVIRDALVDFKEKGKFIIAYGDYYTQAGYYLAATADEVILNPLGIVDLRGFSTQIPFFKDMLDRIGVNMQVYYAGKFKGATEPYRLNELSDANRQQIRTYLDDVYNHFLTGLSDARGLSVTELRQIANDYEGIDPNSALSSSLVDVIDHRDAALNRLRDRLGLEEDEDIKRVSLSTYAKASKADKDYSVKDKIAIIYAEGAIVDGNGTPGTIGDEQYVKYIKEARKSDRIKAIVLRVNSPGGSAMASENIWKEIRLTQEAGKPVVVSMGDYAASGGYYISAAADSIFAEPNTLTGSIGVFSLIPDASDLMNDKLGIHFDTVKTGDFSLGITPFFPMSPQGARLMQIRTDSMYETFLQRVSEGRGLPRDSVHAIAQGRVWTGNAGLKIGLVDALGGLDRAIDAAATLAELDEYRTTDYPKVKDPIQQLMEQWLGEENVRAQAMLKYQLGDQYKHYRLVKDLAESKGVQARMPYLLSY
ncbi:signal peptide peptidase SppA [Phaeodactylibacter sp.]|jgi:protease-4|uniref:signal peptide peptidase SppA n=1 Tax=Phaeodactylibacter sp. TaxID=1940289 RepID=UPI0025F5AC39|nr:signal peptide peptidase SppA [Phaeodactylibacter sp.]MCI4647620.1 signal peptide peptidase SppA [Phaeodactylibacter sp.]MCI5090574.1 signal peptide peptidase SppA [Phaeodactylibacter sp.]